MGRKRQGPAPWVPERNCQFARHLDRLLSDARLGPKGLAALLGRTEVLVYRVMKLTAREFVRRLLLHVLPTGFVRIRHYGMLSNRRRQADLALCRQFLGADTAGKTEPLGPLKSPEEPVSVTPTRVCPQCGAGQMVMIGLFPPLVGEDEPAACREGVDSS